MVTTRDHTEISGLRKVLKLDEETKPEIGNTIETPSAVAVS
jgi:hypothetical protein